MEDSYQNLIFYFISYKITSFMNGDFKVKRACDECFLTLKDIAWVQEAIV